MLRSIVGSSDQALLASFLEELHAEFPAFRIVPKADSRLSRAIDVALRVITFGQMRTYMTRFHTVIGDTLYVPSGWDEVSPRSKVITLRHERVHLRQRRRYSLPGMTVLYLLLPLPLGLAYGRARVEWEAYRETIAATLELRGPDAALDPDLRRHIVEQFTSANYGWMWPFPWQVERWYDQALLELGLAEVE
ncbi:MAG: hypothetical protein AAGA56_14845 [Myxococcota bacterium]